MKPLDIFRLKILLKLAETRSFLAGWSIWEPEIRRLCSPTITASNIFTLGEHLSEVFRLNRIAGRGQASVSGGGSAWECFVTWYLNLVFWDTDVVATRQNRQFVPEHINKALSVTISNQQTNTESDIVVYRVNQDSFRKNVDVTAINAVVAAGIHNTDVAVVQCKTNWNDNAQIPMLWDLIYNSSSSFRIPNVSVGVGGVNPASFRRFAYAFVTVPTSRGPFNPTSLCVLRVKNMTGGNYWGKSSRQGVAGCLNEFFLRNFPDAFVGGISHHLEQGIIRSPDTLEAFLTMDVTRLGEMLAAAIV
jgi:hypothetical protein